MPTGTAPVEEEAPEPKKTTKAKKAPKTPKKKKKPKIEAKRASIPAGKEPSEVTLEDAIHYLALPRDLGVHLTTGEKIIANTGRFGPYIAHDGEFRSLKKGDDPYTITFERAVEIFSTPKPLPKGVERSHAIGKHPVK